MTRINIAAIMVFGILCAALVFQGMQGINGYNKRFNDLTKRQKSSNPSINANATIVSAIRKDIALMLYAEMGSNSRALDNLQKQHMPLYEPGGQNKLYLAMLSISFLLAAIFLAIKYLY